MIRPGEHCYTLGGVPCTVQEVHVYPYGVEYTVRLKGGRKLHRYPANQLIQCPERRLIQESDIGLLIQVGGPAQTPPFIFTCRCGRVLTCIFCEAIEWDREMKRQGKLPLKAAEKRRSRPLRAASHPAVETTGEVIPSIARKAREPP